MRCARACVQGTTTSVTTPTKRREATARRSEGWSYERTLAALASLWVGGNKDSFLRWWASSSDEAKLSLLKARGAHLPRGAPCACSSQCKPVAVAIVTIPGAEPLRSAHWRPQSARELVRQRLAEQGATAALDALCPEFAERLLPRLLPDDVVPSLIEARTAAPDAAREHDAGFLRASWGAVPPGMLSPLRGTPRHAPGAGSAAPPPASPAAFAAQLVAIAQNSAEWDPVDVLTDNRGILVATFWADVLLLWRAVSAGVSVVQGRVTSGPLAGVAVSAPPLAQRATPTSLTLEPGSPAKELAPESTPTPTTPAPVAVQQAEEEAEEAAATAAPVRIPPEFPSPRGSDNGRAPTPCASESDASECTPVPEDLALEDAEQ